MTIDSSWYTRPDNIPTRNAAGGIVVRVEGGGRVMLALAREYDFPGYVLPKGGVDNGESDEQAARREIAEEVGLFQLDLLADLGVRERLNYQKKRWVRTRYFLFQTDQTEGEPLDRKKHYTGATWFPLDGLPNLLWPEQRELIETNRAVIVSSLRAG